MLYARIDLLEKERNVDLLLPALRLKPEEFRGE